MKNMAKTMAALFLVLGACGGGDDGGSGDDTPDIDAAAASVVEVDCATATIAQTITTSGFAYSPATATISVGEVVEFTPMASHDVASGNPGSPDGLFSVGLAGQGCFQFNEAGTYPFHCTPHQFAGTLTVQ
jgi:plastocyanin